MTTPTSQLGMSHIQTEFGGSNPIALSEYYGVNANVPASGTIRMAQFLGISAGPTVQLPANNTTILGGITAFDSYPGEAIAGVSFGTNGLWLISGNPYTGGSSSGTWLTSGTAGQVDIRLDVISGGISAWSYLAPNTWGRVTGDAQWYVENFTEGTIENCSFKISLRSNSTQVILASVTGYFEAEAEK